MMLLLMVSPAGGERYSLRMLLSTTNVVGDVTQTGEQALSYCISLFGILL